MRSIEAKTCPPIVIKVPLTPVSGIVTLLTTRPQSPLVLIILLMARPAFRAGIFEGFIFMTIFAWHVCVLAQERKPAQTVIKKYFFLPGMFVVTAPTLLSFLTFVGIVFFVTAEAGRLEILLIQNAFMTG